MVSEQISSEVSMYMFLPIAEQYEHNFHKEEKMKVDIRHTRHWDLENTPPLGLLPLFPTHPAAT